MGLCKSSVTPTRGPIIQEDLQNTLSSLGNDFSSLVVTVIRGENDPVWTKITKDSLYYKGEWKENFPHGIGTLLNEKKQEIVICCFFQSNPITDKCIKICKDGSLYKGQLNSDWKMNGKGVLKKKEYNYEGNFLNGKFHGKGRYEMGKTVFEGIFEQNKKLQGRQQNEKYEYVGTFVNNKKEGWGVLKWKQGGGRYEGEFKYDLQNGEGKLYNSDGELVRVGKWKHNQMIN